MKRAKRAEVIHKIRIAKTYITEYNCPHCHVNMIGDHVKNNVTRFLCCQCGEEIIVDSVKEVSNE